MITSVSLCLSKTLNCSNKCQCNKIKVKRARKMPVRDKIVEDNDGVISSTIVPTLSPAEEDAMEESESAAGSQ